MVWAEADVEWAVGAVEVEAVEGQVFHDKRCDGEGGHAGDKQVAGLAAPRADEVAAAVQFAAGVLVEARGDAGWDVAGERRAGKAEGEGERAEVVDEGIEQVGG